MMNYQARKFQSRQNFEIIRTEFLFVPFEHENFNYLMLFQISNQIRKGNLSLIEFILVYRVNFFENFSFEFKEIEIFMILHGLPIFSILC